MRNIFRLSAFLLLLVVFAQVAAASTEKRSMPEYEVKAAFLYNFAKFITWPDEWTRMRPDTIVVAVIGDDPFGVVLDGLKMGAISGKNVHVERYENVEQITRCDVLFISTKDVEEARRIIASTDQLSILTVGECEGFTGAGGMIRFFLNSDSRVRFEINIAATSRADLDVSSKLLKIARVTQK